MQAGGMGSVAGGLHEEETAASSSLFFWFTPLRRTRNSPPRRRIRRYHRGGGVSPGLRAATGLTPHPRRAAAALRAAPDLRPPPAYGPPPPELRRRSSGLASGPYYGPRATAALRAATRRRATTTIRRRPRRRHIDATVRSRSAAASASAASPSRTPRPVDAATDGMSYTFRLGFGLRPGLILMWDLEGTLVERHRDRDRHRADRQPRRAADLRDPPAVPEGAASASRRSGDSERASQHPRSGPGAAPGWSGIGYELIQGWNWSFDIEATPPARATTSTANEQTWTNWSLVNFAINFF